MLAKFLKSHSSVNVTLVDQTMVSGVNFLTGLLIARFLGVDQFGKFTLLWMIVLFCNSIQMAMISAPMMSIGPKQSKEQSASYYNTVAFQQILFSIATFLILYFCIQLSASIFPEWHVDEYALPIALAGMLFQGQDFLRRYFFSRQCAMKALLNDIVSYLGQLSLLFILFFSSELNVEKVLWTIAGTSAIAIAYGATKIQFSFPSLDEFKTVCKRHWDFSKWMILSAIMQWSSGNLFIVSAGSVLGLGAIGALKAAQNIIGITHIIFQAVENFVPVKASIAYQQKGTEGLLQYLKKVVLIGGGSTSFICLLVALFPELLMSLFYSNEYIEYAYILQCYAVIYILGFLCLPIRYGLRALEATKPISVGYALTALFSICFASPFVNSFGINGALIGIGGTAIIMILSLSFSLMFEIRKNTKEVENESHSYSER